MNDAKGLRLKRRCHPDGGAGCFVAPTRTEGVQAFLLGASSNKAQE
jgi:hypothetical protein